MFLAIVGNLKLCLNNMFIDKEVHFLACDDESDLIKDHAEDCVYARIRYSKDTQRIGDCREFFFSKK